MELADAPPARFPLKHLGYLAAYAFTASVLVTDHLLGGATWMAPLLAFVLVPTVDVVLGRDEDNVAPEEETSLSGKRFYTALLYAWTPLQLAIVAYGAWRFAAPETSALARVGLVASVGVIAGGFGITIAHELGHRSGALDKLCTRVLLGAVCYLHFTIEHNRGHHLRVATPADPATARLHEGFYRFLLRTLPGQYLSAWHLESERLKRQGRSPLHPSHRMIWFSAAPFAAAALFFLWLGPLGVVFFLAQAAIAVGILEGVNYIEHYGLLRREVSPGVYERVTPLHSWNASWPLSNWLLFGLQRHADHHAHAGRRYQVLRHLEEGPQLPAGYTAMLPLILVPPLWRRVMDERARDARRLAGVEG